MDFERFDIIKTLGKGRTGGVYEALDTFTNHRVALRRFFSIDGNTDSSAWEASFIGLVYNLAKVKHPALMSIHSAGVDDDGAFMVMELLEGGRSIEKIVEQEKHLSDENFYVMANNLLDAFSLMHYMGYCHGSVSGRSVMEVPLPTGGKVYKCVDLGMSSLIPMVNPSMPSLAFGDPALTAPELFEGALPDARSDVYMLGHLFYLSLAGGHPLAGIPPEEAHRKHKGHKFAPLSGYRSSVPKDIVDWIEFLTQADPESRPQSAGEALEAMPIHHFASQETPAPEALVTATAPAQQAKLLSGSGPSLRALGKKPLPNRLPITAKKSSAPLVVVSILALGIIVLFIVIVGSSGSSSLPVTDEPADEINLNEEPDPLTETGDPVEIDPESTDPKPEVPRGPREAELAQMKRITYHTPQVLISLDEISEGVRLEEALSLEKAKAWQFIEEGESHSGGDFKITLESDLLRKTGKTGLSVEKGGKLFDSFNGLRFSGASIPDNAMLRYTLQGCEGKLKARLYTKLKNLKLASGVAIADASKLPEGVSLSKAYSGQGLCYIDLEIDSPIKGERFAIDFKLLETLDDSKPASLTPIAFLVYEEFPPPPAFELETENLEPLLQPNDKIAKEFPDGVKITPNGDGTNTLELQPKS